MPDQPTCGKGLAENSVLPAKLGELVAAQAEVLTHHMTALDLGDPDARQEYEAYAKLAGEFRLIAASLGAVAGDMAGYRDLPMGRHKREAMTSPAAQMVFAAFVAREQETLQLLQRRVPPHLRLLDEMRHVST